MKSKLYKNPHPKGEVEARTLRVDILRPEAREIYRKGGLPKFQVPKPVAGTISNRYRTVIIVFAQFYDVVLSHKEQKGGEDVLA